MGTLIDFIFQVFWATSPTHMDNNIFYQPEKYDPSRFENPTKTIPPYTYIPFGAGPRICPGAEFARIEVLLIIHHLIANYSWTEAIPNEPLTREPFPYPAMGLPIKLHPRKDVQKPIFMVLSLCFSLQDVLIKSSSWQFGIMRVQ